MSQTSLTRTLLAALCVAFVACGDHDSPGGNDSDSGPSDDGGNAGSSGRGGSGRGAFPPRDSGTRDSGEEDAGRDAGDRDASGDEDAGNVVACTRDSNCDDDDACTQDECDNGVCSNDAIDVDDDDACTTDSCDPDTGVEHDAVDPDDGNDCTTDSCDSDTGVSHVMVAIDDSDMCTTDACDPATGNITHTAVSTDDSDMCTTDSCVPATGVAHTPVSVDDNDMCTTDACDSGTGSITHTPVATTDNDMCTTDTCNPATGALSHTPVAVDDSDACTTDACDPGTGVSHTPISVDDADACTTDSCVSPAGTVVNAFCTSNMCDTTSSCLNLTTTNVTDTPALFIPAGPVVVSDTIEVSGAGTILWDLNVRTSITHTFNADLDITLTSPAGTIVTLTTDNGGGNDNGFNGTVWNDSANPMGAVPYVSNASLVTDHPYVNLTTATPLAPEEAFAAFIGENPNGTWILTIPDDAGGDSGTVAEWGLDITTISALPTVTVQTFTQGTDVVLPDNTVTTSTVVVPADAAAGTSLCSLTVETNIIHPNNTHLDITLTSPAGTVVTLTTDNGAADVFAGTTWNDDSDPLGAAPPTSNQNLVADHTYANFTVVPTLVPEEPLSSLIGEGVVGTWTLSISDDTAADTGTLDSWALNIGRCLRAP